MPACTIINRLRHYFIYGLLLVMPGHLWSQNYNEDSVKKVIAESKNDTARIEAMLSYGSFLLKEKKDTAGLALLLDGKKLAEKLQHHEGIAWAWLNLGSHYRRENDWEKSIESNKQGILTGAKIADEEKRKLLLLRAYNNLGGIFNINGDYATSLENRLKSLEIIESLPRNNNNIALATINTASDYRQLKQFGKANEYITRVGKLFDSISNRMKLEYLYEFYHITLNSADTVRAERILHNMDSLLTTLELTKFQKLDYGVLINKMHGDYEMKHTHDYSKALPYFEKCFEGGLAMKNKVEITSGLHNMGWAYYEMKSYPQAIIYFKRAFDTAQKADMPHHIMKSAAFLSAVYDETGQGAKGMYYSRLAYNLKDSLNSAEKVEQLNFLEAKYQNVKKEKEITNLQKANQESEFVIRRKNWTIVGAVVLLGLLLALSGMIYRYYKNRQQLILKEKALQQEQIVNLEKQQQVIALQSMINGQEGERTRIARDLHDGLGGIFSTVKMHFSTLQHEVPELKGNNLYRKSFEMVDGASEELRKIAHNMMPEVLMKMGLVPALQDFCNNINAGKQLHVNLQAYGMDKRLSASIEIMLFRIIQELINNIIKHSGASESIIQFNRNANNLTITVEDNGRGFDVNELEAKRHMGLQTIKSRVAFLDGRISIDSKTGVGTTVMIDLLLNEQ